MTDNNLPSVEYLHKRLLCDAKSGKLFWRDCDDMPMRWRKRWAGAEALRSINGHGYLHGRINFQKLYTHRVVWAMANGEWPVNQIDHINGIRTDNRISNLRSVSNQENSKNQKLRSDNTSGVCGVWMLPKSGKWAASMRINGRAHHIGTYYTLEDAFAARSAASQAHGFSDRHGTSFLNDSSTPARLGR